MAEWILAHAKDIFTFGLNTLYPVGILDSFVGKHER